MKKLIVVFLILSFAINAKSSEMNRISFYSYIEQNKDLSTYSSDFLKNKLDQLLLANSVGSKNSKRFVLFTRVTFEDISITSTIPAMYKIKLSVDVIVGDNFEEKSYGIYTFKNLIGVDANKEKALIGAFKGINNSVDFKNFIVDTKHKIIEYYKDNCDLIIQKSLKDKEVKKFDEAIENLSKIPEICDSCFKSANDNIILIFKAKQEFECEESLRKIQALMSNDKYEEATELLAKIPPGLSCDNKVKELIDKIEKHWCALEVAAANGAWLSRNMDELASHLSMIPDNSPCVQEVKILRDKVNSTLDLESKQKHELKIKQLNNEREKQIQDFNLNREQQISDNQFRSEELKTNAQISRLNLEYNERARKDNVQMQSLYLKSAERIATQRLNNERITYEYLLKN
jgi:hypothetical protein